MVERGEGVAVMVATEHQVVDGVDSVETAETEVV